MVLQQPPMKFACNPAPGGKFDEAKHELHFGSDDPNHPDAVIQYFTFPALYHGDRLMRKSRVIMHIPPPPPVKVNRRPKRSTKQNKWLYQ